MLNVLSNHLELASAGWLATRWAEMSDDEEGGFDGFGVDLHMKLAAIDNGENVE